MNRLEQLLYSLSAHELAQLKFDWSVWARKNQLPPAGDWTTWLLLGGRGAGKTRAGAEWVRAKATGKKPQSPIALVGETINDTREVMIEGLSGLMTVHRDHERPVFHRARNRLEWPNGATARLYSSRDPESLRGPQFALAWCDEFCKWQYPQETWDMLQFGLRVGQRPQQLITTTPKPMALLKRIIASQDTRVTRIKTAENADNLAPAFLEKIVGNYQGTLLGRQELYGEILEEARDSLWTLARIDQCRVSDAGVPERIIVAVDPPISSGERSDKCGIVVVGKRGAHFYVLADLSIARATPLVWSSKVVTAFEQFQADCVVAEVNQGGDLVVAALHQISPGLPVRTVHARRGKWLRAEPVALLYERQLVHHVGNFAELEDEMCRFTTNGLAGGHSPDRLDALVWAITELARLDNAHPRIRTI